MTTAIVRIFFITLTAVLLFLILNVYWVQSWMNQYPYDCRRILQLALLSVTLLWLYCDFPLQTLWIKLYQTFPTPARTGILIFFALGLISSLLAPLTQYALLQVGLYALLWIFAVTIATLRLHYAAHFDRVALLCLFVMTAVYGIYLLYVDVYLIYLIPAGSSANLMQISAPSFEQLRFFSQFLSFSLPLMVLPLLLYPQQSRVFKCVCFIVASVWWYAMIINHSRALWLEWGIIIIAVIGLFRRDSIPWVKWQLYTAMTGAALYTLIIYLPIWLQHTPSHAPLGFFNDWQRPAIWWYTLKMIAQHPVFGIGPLHYAYYFQPAPWPAHPHDSILNIAVEWGIPATLILLALVLWAFTRWLKDREFCMQKLYTPQVSSFGEAHDPKADTVYMRVNEEAERGVQQSSTLERRGVYTTHLYLALTAAFISGSCDSLVNGVVVMPLGQLPLAIIAGWMMGLYQSVAPCSTVETPVKTSSHLFWYIASLTALGLMLWGIYPMVFQLHQIFNRFYQDVCINQQLICQLSPNFWLEGWIQYYNT